MEAREEGHESGNESDVVGQVEILLGSNRRILELSTGSRRLFLDSRPGRNPGSFMLKPETIWTPAFTGMTNSHLT
jgi:hypothetical protein